MITTRFSRFLILLASVAIVAGCAPQAFRPTQAQSGTAGSQIVASDLRALAASAEVIVIGSIRSTGGTRNIARDAIDRTKASSTYTVQAQDFGLEIEEFVKGTAGSEIVVSLVTGRGPAGLPLAAVEGYEPFTIGNRYLLFLTSIPGTGTFGQTPEPFRFELTSSARAMTANAEARRRFPTRSTNAFLEDVRAAAR